MTVTQIVTCDGCGKQQQEGEHFWLVHIERWDLPPLYVHVHNWICFTAYGVRRAEEFNVAIVGAANARA